MKNPIKLAAVQGMGKKYFTGAKTIGPEKDSMNHIHGCNTARHATKIHEKLARNHCAPKAM